MITNSSRWKGPLAQCSKSKARSAARQIYGRKETRCPVEFARRLSLVFGECSIPAGDAYAGLSSLLDMPYRPECPI